MRLSLFAGVLAAAVSLAGAAFAQSMTVEAPASYVPQQAVAFGDRGQAATSVSASNPLPTLPTGFTGGVRAVPTVTAASAYTSGNSMGGLLTFMNVLRTGKSTGLLQSVNLNFKSAQSSPVDLVLFSASPTATTIADKTAFSLAVADFDKVIGVVHVSDCTSLGTPSVCTATGLATSLTVPSGQTVYGVLITRGTPTFTATSDVSVQLVVVQD